MKIYILDSGSPLEGAFYQVMRTLSSQQVEWISDNEIASRSLEEGICLHNCGFTGKYLFPLITKLLKHNVYLFGPLSRICGITKQKNNLLCGHVNRLPLGLNETRLAPASYLHSRYKTINDSEFAELRSNILLPIWQKEGWNEEQLDWNKIDGNVAEEIHKIECKLNGRAQ